MDLAREKQTICDYLARHAFERGDKPAFRQKSLGIWRTWTWHEVNELVRSYAVGLSNVGVKRGMTVPVMGSSRPMTYWTFLALQMIGAIPVPLFSDATLEELVEIFPHVDTGIAVVEDEQQMAALASIGVAKRHTIVFDRSRVHHSVSGSTLIEMDAVIEHGRSLLKEASTAAWLDRELSLTQGSDLASIVFTPGTSGTPKGVVITFDRCIAAAKDTMLVDGLTDSDCVVACLPTGWAADHYLTYVQALVVGFCVACPESHTTIGQDTREIGPTLYYATPAIYETAALRFQDALGGPGAIGRRVASYFMRVARRVVQARSLKVKIPVHLALLHGLGWLIVHGAVRNLLGLSRVRLAYVLGGALPVEIVLFYRAIGIELRHLYGQTEAFFCIATAHNEYAGGAMVASPLRNVDVRIDENGEILLKSPGLFVSYFKNDRLTRLSTSSDGYFRTGDVGYLDSGNLVFVDRAENIGRLTNGIQFSARTIEYELRQSHLIQEALVFGDGRDYIGAFILVDSEKISEWAETCDLPHASYEQLVANPRVYDLIEREVRVVNAKFSRDASTSSLAIRRFMLLRKPFESGRRDMTRIRTLRRAYLAERMKSSIDALFHDAPDMSSEVTGDKAVDDAKVAVRVVSDDQISAEKAA